jgi:hypothetical protein
MIAKWIAQNEGFNLICTHLSIQLFRFKKVELLSSCCKNKKGIIDPDEVTTGDGDPVLSKKLNRLNNFITQASV